MKYLGVHAKVSSSKTHCKQSSHEFAGQNSH